MDARVVKMRERRDAFLAKAANAQAEAAKLDRAIKARENEAISSLVRALSNKFVGGMDEIYEKLQSLSGQAQDAPPEGGAMPAPKTAEPELSKKELEDDSIENE